IPPYKIRTEHIIQFFHPTTGMFLTHFIRFFDQLGELTLVMGMPDCALMHSLLAHAHGPIKLIQRIIYFSCVFSEPSDGGVLKFFLISTLRSSPAMSIIFSKKSILICFWPIIRSSSRIRCSIAFSLLVLLDFISIIRCPFSLKLENL